MGITLLAYSHETQTDTRSQGAGACRNEGMQEVQSLVNRGVCVKA